MFLSPAVIGAIFLFVLAHPAIEITAVVRRVTLRATVSTQQIVTCI